MSRVCELCGKRPNSAFAVSHSNRHTKKRQLPNLIKIRVPDVRGGRRSYVCSKCLKKRKSF